MVTLTFAVTMRLLYFAVNSVKKGEVHIKQYRTYEGEFPPKLNSVRQHYKNMFEIKLFAHPTNKLLNISNNINFFIFSP